MDRDTLKTLMELKVETSQKSQGDPDASINTLSWRYLVTCPTNGMATSGEYIWQPTSTLPNTISSRSSSAASRPRSSPCSSPFPWPSPRPSTSQLARPRVREIAKPVIELLAGIPSVVLGFFGLIVMATVLQKVFGYESRLNAFVAGIALGFSVIPVVFHRGRRAHQCPRTYVRPPSRSAHRSGRRPGRWCSRPRCPEFCRRGARFRARRWQKR